MVQLAHATGDAIEVFHHVFDRLIAFASIFQPLGDAELTIEQQTVVVAIKFKVQGKANAPQQMQTFVKLVTLGLGEEAKADHFIERGGAKVTAGDPLDGVDVAQAAGAAFNVRFQIVAGTVVALVACLLLGDFRREKVFRRPEAFAEDMFLKLKKQRNVANQQT